jgi:carbonic anhydrase
VAEQQSPVIIGADAPVHQTGISTSYRAVAGVLGDNPNAVQLEFAPGCSAVIGGSRWELEQFHFHSPGEHAIDEQRAVMEVHLVHRGTLDRLAVMGMMLVEGASNPALEATLAALDGAASVTVDPSDLLPADRRHVTYTGSLTAEPYTTGVRWRVFLRPVQASAEQLAAIRAVHSNNNRPLQPLIGRPFESALKTS